MKRVLIVDDALFMRTAIRTMLERNGYEVVGEAEDGAVGVEKYKELNPDIVTLDITMPEMDGLQSLKEIIKFDPKAKAIMVSALGQEKHIREAVIIGAKSFVVKPINETHLIKTLNQL